MGMPLYGAQPPTGYSMKAETWVSSSALLNRMNFALALTERQDQRRESGCGAACGKQPPTLDANLRRVGLEAGLLAAGYRSRRTTRSWRKSSGRERKALRQRCGCGDRTQSTMRMCGAFQSE